jgi:hypothetical protein
MKKIEIKWEKLFFYCPFFLYAIISSR